MLIDARILATQMAKLLVDQNPSLSVLSLSDMHTYRILISCTLYVYSIFEYWEGLNGSAKSKVEFNQQ